MRRILLAGICLFIFSSLRAQEDIVLNLDSIKNIRTTRYSSINEVGVAISVAGTKLLKLLSGTVKTNLGTEKPSVMFRTVHGALINPKLFIGAGLGLDFRPNSPSGVRSYFFTFPFFAEFREYVLEGNFNMFFSERLGGAVFIDSYINSSINRGTYSGAFGEFMIGGRYVPPAKRIAIHFGVGYRLQHLQRKIDVTDGTGSNVQVFSNTPEISIKHYVPITLGVTF